MTASRAQETAQGLLAEALPRRWMHVQGVAGQAAQVAASLALGEVGAPAEILDSGYHLAQQEHREALVRLLDDVPPRYRALLLLATFANLRFGELAGLRRDQLDLDKCLVRVAVSTAEMDDGRLIDAGPKSRAGTRTVAFPREIVPELRWHLECFAQSEKDGGLVFVGPLGSRLRRSNFRRFWYKARDAVGLPELHFHDLRHTGNTMAAAQGASLRELMERMGHSSTRAALIYLHATQERDQAIAAGMGKLLSEARKTGRRPNRSGTQRARGRRSAS